MSISYSVLRFDRYYFFIVALAMRVTVSATLRQCEFLAEPGSPDLRHALRTLRFDVLGLFVSHLCRGLIKCSRLKQFLKIRFVRPWRRRVVHSNYGRL